MFYYSTDFEAKLLLELQSVAESYPSDWFGRLLCSPEGVGSGRLLGGHCLRTLSKSFAHSCFMSLLFCHMVVSVLLNFLKEDNKKYMSYEAAFQAVKNFLCSQNMSVCCITYPVVVVQLQILVLYIHLLIKWYSKFGVIFLTGTRLGVILIEVVVFNFEIAISET